MRPGRSHARTWGTSSTTTRRMITIFKARSRARSGWARRATRLSCTVDTSRIQECPWEGRRNALDRVNLQRHFTERKQHSSKKRRQKRKSRNSRRDRKWSCLFESYTNTVYQLRRTNTEAQIRSDKIVGFHDATRLATLHNSAMHGPLTPRHLSSYLYPRREV